MGEDSELVTQVQAAKLAGVPKQNIHRAIHTQHALALVEGHPHPVLRRADVLAWMAREKSKGGRPRTRPAACPRVGGGRPKNTGTAQETTAGEGKGDTP